MQIPDVNVLVHAWRPESADHERARDWLETTTALSSGIGLPDVVGSGAIRVLTMRVSGLGAELADVLASMDGLRSHVTAIQPGRRHWSIFTNLCRQTGATGNKIPDCYLAAFAIEREATLVSRDQFFAQLPGLDWADLP